MWKSVLRAKLVEYVRLDSWLGGRGIALLTVTAGLAYWAIGRSEKALRLFTMIHRADCSPLADRFVEWFLRPKPGQRDSGRQVRLRQTYRDYIANYPRKEAVGSLFDNPAALLNSRALVLKSARPDEKGVLLLDYNFVLPVFAKFFDVKRVAERYRIVFEPSWSGLCDLDILCYTPFDFRVFMEALEPRDAQFLRSLNANLVPLPIASNWWVDHRVFRPLPEVKKEVDLIMLASWAPFKRHIRFFESLSRLRSRGHRPSVLLVGYPYQTTTAQILQEARYFGIADQLQIKENLSPEEVNVELNRSRINVLWSRREGVNRAIIEGMFAGVPCIVRDGFNYGYHYPYINESTGCYATEDGLPDRILSMLEPAASMRPRDWVMENMTCQLATKIIADAVRAEALAAGEPWREDLAVKVSRLTSMRYWDDEDRSRFASDYEYLASCLS